MARSINREKFSAAVTALKTEPVQNRLVDVLLPLREELLALRKDSRTYVEIWRVVNKADVECTYPNCVRALKQVLADRVQPLEQARARSRAKRAAVKALPAVPVGLRPEPTAMPANMGPMYGDPYQQAATRQVAGLLVETFGPKKAKT